MEEGARELEMLPPSGRGKTVLACHPHHDLYGSGRMFVATLQALRESDEPWRVVAVVEQDGTLADVVRQLDGVALRLRRAPVLRKQDAKGLGLLRLAASMLIAIPRLAHLIRQEGADLVYVSTLTAPVWLAAARLARVPVVCHVHEAENELPRWLRLLLASPLLLSRIVLVNSQAAARELTGTLRRLGRRLRLVYNGVEHPADAGEAAQALPGAVRLVLVGRISPRKGTDVAVEALIELRRRGVPAQLHVVGDTFAGYEWYEQSLHERVAMAGVAESVLFEGFQADPWKWYRNADIVLVPSRQEPFGNVAVEAQLAARPVVVAGVQGLTEIVTDGETGLVVPPEDPAALADAVARLVNDPALSTRLAGTARDAANRRFSLARYQAQIREELESVVAG